MYSSGYRPGRLRFLPELMVFYAVRRREPVQTGLAEEIRSVFSADRYGNGTFPWRLPSDRSRDRVFSTHGFYKDIPVLKHRSGWRYSKNYVGREASKRTG